MSGTPPSHGPAPRAGWLSWHTGGLDRRYWSLWGGVASSNLGDGLVALAIPWLASLLTRDALLISGVALATRLPWLLFSLLAGAYGDRLDRRRLMIGANSARTVVAGALAVAVAADIATLPMLYLGAFLLGTCEVLFDNTAQALLPSLVPGHRLERANGNLMGAQMVIAEFLARPIAGALVGVALSLPFAIDAATAAVSAAVIGALPATRRTPRDASEPRPAVRTEIVDGLRWLWSHQLLRTLAFSLGVMNAVSAAVMATFVLFAQELLGLDGLGFGLLLAVGSTGALVGSVVGPSAVRRIGTSLTLRLTIVAPILVALVIAATSNAVLAGLAFAVYGATSVGWNIVTVSLRQRLIPDTLLGRVNSVYRFFGWGAMPIGTLLGGAMVQLVEGVAGRDAGLRAPFVMMALVHLVLLVTVASRLSTAAFEAAGSGPTRS